MDDALRIVLGRLGSAKQSGGQWMAKCPAHEDGTASLSIARGKEQPVVFNCHAGCDSESILAELKLTWEDISAPREEPPPADAWTPFGPAEAAYPYHDEHGNLLFEVLRAPGKKFIQRKPDPHARSGWAYKIGDTRRVLFHLPKLIRDLASGEIAYIAEGEKDVLALERHGCTATCNPGGAGKWRGEYSEVFRDAIVRIVADRDDAGQKHARQVFRSLEDVAAAVEIIEAAGEGLPGGAHVKDAADHFAAGHAVEDFVVTHTEGVAAPDLAPDLHEFIAVDDPPEDWIIPLIIERGDRLIWTGVEGMGKSVFVRMLAVAAAAGLHPFERATFQPRKVLIIDCENGERKSRKAFRRLERTARLKGQRVPDGQLRIIIRPEGVDLLSEDGAEWLLERVTAHKPDLLCVGPFYRLHNADMNDERAARLATVVLDRARVRAGCALITEAHAPHNSGPSKLRPVRPVGSSLLMRWPELGYGIRPSEDADESDRAESGHWTVADVAIWRPPRDDGYRWPKQLMWGELDSDWPWVDASRPGLHIAPVPYDHTGTE